MFIIETYSTAVVFCVMTMICWGSWANTQKLAAADWRFELFYWDYVMGIVALAILFAFSFGSVGDGGRSFVTDWQQAGNTSIGFAVLGGVIFNAAVALLLSSWLFLRDASSATFSRYRHVAGFNPPYTCSCSR